MWLVGGFNPLKNMKVSWDDSSQYMESHKIHVPNHQPDGGILHEMFSNMNQLYVIHVHGEFRGIVTPFIEATTWSAKVRPWTVHRWRVLAAWHPDGTPNSWMFHIPPNIWGGSIHGGTPFVAGWFIYSIMEIPNLKWMIIGVPPFMESLIWIAVAVDTVDLSPLVLSKIWIPKWMLWGGKRIHQI